MKKIIALLLAATMLALFGCSDKSNDTQSSSETVTTLSPTVSVTFPEGYTAVQIAQRLEENSVCSAKAFMAAVMSPAAFAEEFDFVAQIDNIENRAFALEGYIFPDTYEFYRGESAESAVRRFLKNFENKITEDFRQQAKLMDMTVDEVVTLASIIQKEAGMKSEMAKVSSVLHNRLTDSSYGKLQCDVTINYVNDYITDSPYLEGDTAGFAPLYNTYKCTLLPAGAICNPGADAVEAALFPQDTDYYYFVTDSQKNYYYASTYEEHKINCEKCGIQG